MVRVQTANLAALICQLWVQVPPSSFKVIHEKLRRIFAYYIFCFGDHILFNYLLVCLSLKREKMEEFDLVCEKCKSKVLYEDNVIVKFGIDPEQAHPYTCCGMEMYAVKRNKSPGKISLEMAKASLEKVMKENGSSFIRRNNATYEEIELTQEQADALFNLPKHDDSDLKSVPLGDPKDVR